MVRLPDRAPPAWAEAMLRALLPPAASVEFIVGDLREEYVDIRRSWPTVVAAMWYAGVALRTGVRGRWERRQSGRAAVRDSRGGTPKIGADGMRVELRQAARYLVRRPGISAATVLTVALAIAATTVAFTVVNGVLLERMPYRDPDGLVVLWEHHIPRDRHDNVVSPANFMTWRERATSFEDLGAAIAASAVVTGVGEPERVGAAQASASIFRMIGASALAGRLYGDDDDREGADPVVVLSEGYWRRRFGADPSVIGQTLRLNDNAAIIIGVLPERFDVPIAAEFSSPGTHDVWQPLRYGESARTASGRFLQVFGRLRPGVSLEAARSEMTLLAARLRDEFPVRQAGWDVTVLTLRDEVVGDIRSLVLIIFGAVCLVLLIACANVANLQLTRASARQQEMAVRSALGAGRGRLIRQMLMESFLLSVVGGAFGLLLASLTVRSLIRAAPDIPRVETLGIDGPVIAFALIATAGTALLFGLAPALHIAGGDVAGWLKERGAGRERRSGNRLRNGLVVAQVALSLVLLVGAGLLVRSFANRIAVGVGFDMERMLTAEVQLPSSRYDAPAQTRFFEDRHGDRGAGPRRAAADQFHAFQRKRSRPRRRRHPRLVGIRPGRDGGFLLDHAAEVRQRRQQHSAAAQNPPGQFRAHCRNPRPRAAARTAANAGQHELRADP
jgi:predicted permease